MNNEVSIEEQDKSCKEAAKMKRDSEHKLEELSRRLGVMEVRFQLISKLSYNYVWFQEELKKTEERANSADQKVLYLEEEMKIIGDNMKQLEILEENALKRE